MKTKKQNRLLKKAVLTALSVTLLTSLLFAQEEQINTVETIDKSEKIDLSSTNLNLDTIKKHALQSQRDSNYLDNFLISLNTERIYKNIAVRLSRLYPIVQNFNERFPNQKKSVDQKQEYEGIISSFDLAISYSYEKKHSAYKNVAIYVQLKMKRLYRALADIYKVDVKVILDKARTDLVKYSHKPVKNYAYPLSESAFRNEIIIAKGILGTAYKHWTEANRLYDKEDFYNAVLHYRLTGFYTVQLLKALEHTPETKAAVLKQYNHVIRDANGLLINPEPVTLQ